MSTSAFATLVNSAKSCRLCEHELEHGVRPVFQVHSRARVLIAGQAPGLKVHRSGIPFDDASGDRLRDWMGIGREIFYDEKKVSILPMGFCYPGKGRSGDLPPKRICAETWRKEFLAELKHIRLTLVIGQYAQAWHLPKTYTSLTETVKHWHQYDACIPLPHPSPRNNGWMKRNEWFELEVLPTLQKRIKALVVDE